MNFDRVELIETTFDRRLTAGVGDQGVIDASFGHRIEEQTAPLTRSGAVASKSFLVSNDPEPP